MAEKITEVAWRDLLAQRDALKAEVEELRAEKERAFQDDVERQDDYIALLDKARADTVRYRGMWERLESVHGEKDMYFGQTLKSLMCDIEKEGS